MTVHREDRAKLGWRCTCGYEARDERELDDHIDYMVRIGDHEEGS
jgi:hypothetical protein